MLNQTNLICKKLKFCHINKEIKEEIKRINNFKSEAFKNIRCLIFELRKSTSFIWEMASIKKSI